MFVYSIVPFPYILFVDDKQVKEKVKCQNREEWAAWVRSEYSRDRRQGRNESGLLNSDLIRRFELIFLLLVVA